MIRNLLLALALTFGLAAPAAAQMSSGAATVQSPERAIPFAKQVERALAERGAAVAIISRVGRDPRHMPDGVGEYTHVGLWVYSEIETADGRKVPGYVAWNLYQKDDNPNRSHLVEDFPAEFFGEVFELKAGVVIPTPELQAELLRVIASPAYRDLHVADYSVVANPFEWRYQNCTNFVMALLTTAIYGTEDRREISQHLRAHYEPRPVALNGLVRAAGSVFVDGFATSDHRGAPLRTSTFGSIADFLKRYDLAAVELEITEAGIVTR